MRPISRKFAAALLMLAGTALPLAATAGDTPEGGTPPAGIYHLDPAHARLIFSVNHLGFSEYTAFFRTLSADLAFDPANPEKMVLNARVDPASIETFNLDPTLDFNKALAGETFLDVKTYPDMTFKSTRVVLTGPNRAAVTGDLTLHGVTRPVTLRVRYNGGYAGNPLDPGGARIGFSADGALFRSDFGIGFGIPAPGSMLGVGDLVAIHIEAEFLNPDVSGVQVGP